MMALRPTTHAERREAAELVSSDTPLRFVSATNDSFGYGPLTELWTGYSVSAGQRAVLLRKVDQQQSASRFERAPAPLLNERGPLELVLFVDAKAVVRDLLPMIREMHSFHKDRKVNCIVVIESLAVHQHDSCAIAMERFLVETLRPLVDRLSLLRAGHLCWLGRDSLSLPHWFRELLPESVTSTFVDIHQLRDVIEDEFRGETCASRAALPFRIPCRRISVPGSRKPLCRSGLVSRQRTGQDSLGSASGDGRPQSTRSVRSLIHGTARKLVRLATPLFKVLSPVFQQLTPEEFQPETVQELLSLCHRHSRADIQIAGHNNGVHHFGWQFPGKTVIRTTRMNGRIRILQDRIVADAGRTLFDCLNALKSTAREFCVVPNYSFIAMGTLFFVPIHGSGSRVSTMGETIDKVLLFHTESHDFVVAHRGSRVFQDAMYDRNSGWIALRLSLRTQQKQTLRVESFVLQKPSAQELRSCLQHPAASHVEIRKAKASQDSVNVRSYFSGDPGDTLSTSRQITDVPRDQIGRLWDRIEQTPVLSRLFHWYVRTQAFHTELFLTDEEFDVFWKHHGTLPLSKIQIRKMHRDGMQHSPCRDKDLVSVDLFMSRSNHDVFCRFIKDQLPDAQHNPGKQSPGTR